MNKLLILKEQEPLSLVIGVQRLTPEVVSNLVFIKGLDRDGVMAVGETLVVLLKWVKQRKAAPLDGFLLLDEVLLLSNMSNFVGECVTLAFHLGRAHLLAFLEFLLRGLFVVADAPFEVSSNLLGIRGTVRRSQKGVLLEYT